MCACVCVCVCVCVVVYLSEVAARTIALQRLRVEFLQEALVPYADLQVANDDAHQPLLLRRAEALLEDPEKGVPVNWPWTKGPKEYRDSLSIIRLLQGDFVPDCKEILILGGQHVTTGKLLYSQKQAEIQSSRLGFHGDWGWCWPSWLSTPSRRVLVAPLGETLLPLGQAHEFP